MIGFTGTRNGLTGEQAMELARQFFLFGEHEYFMHGDCIGADAEADEIAYAMGFKIKMRPCNIDSQRAFCKSGIIIAEPIAPLDRNRLIVDDCDLIIACPKGFEEELRSGTWATVRYAKKVNKKVIIIYPDGTTKVKDG